MAEPRRGDLAELKARARAPRAITVSDWRREARERWSERNVGPRPTRRRPPRWPRFCGRMTCAVSSRLPPWAPGPPSSVGLPPTSKATASSERCGDTVGASRTPVTSLSNCSWGAVSSCPDSGGGVCLGPCTSSSAPKASCASRSSGSGATGRRDDTGACSVAASSTTSEPARAASGAKSETRARPRTDNSWTVPPAGSAGDSAGARRSWLSDALRKGSSRTDAESSASTSSAAAGVASRSSPLNGISPSASTSASGVGRGEEMAVAVARAPRAPADVPSGPANARRGSADRTRTRARSAPRRSMISLLLTPSPHGAARVLLPRRLPTPATGEGD